MTRIWTKKLFSIGSVFVIFLALAHFASERLHKKHESYNAEIYEGSLDALNIDLQQKYEKYQRDLLYWSKERRVISLSRRLVGSPREKLLGLYKEGMDVLGDFIKISGHEGFFLISPEGINLSSSRKSNIGLKSLILRDSENWNKVLKGESVQTNFLKSDVPLSDEDGNLVAGRKTQFILSPVYDGNKLISVIAFRVSPQRIFFNAIKIFQKSTKGKIIATDKKGDLLCSYSLSVSPYGQVIKEKVPFENSVIKNFVNSPDGSLIKIKNGLLAYKKKASSLDLQLLLIADEIDALKEFQDLKVLVYIVNLLLALIFSVVILYLLARSKDLEDQSEETKEIINSIFKAIPHGLAVINKKGEFIYTNDNFIEITGLPPDNDWKKWPEIYGCYRADGKTLFEANELPIIQALDGKECRNERMVLKNRFSGEVKNIKIDSVSIKDQNGEVQYGAVCFENINETITKEEKLKQLIIDSRMIESMGKIGGWKLDIETLKTSWSEEVYKIYELETDVILNEGEAMSFYPKHERPRLKRCLNDCIKYGKEFDEEFEFITKFGKKIWVRSMGRPMFNSNGEIFQLTGTFQDITEIKKKERDSDLILKHVKVGIWEYDPINNISSWDKSMFELYGIDGDDYAGVYEAWEQTLHPDDKERMNLEVQMALNNEKDFDTTFAIIHGDGEKRYIGARAYVERNAMGQAINMIGVNWDRTKEVEALMALEAERKVLVQTSKLASLGELAAGVAHEINNPLTVINGNCSLLKRNADDSEKVKELADRLMKSSRRIQVIVDGLRKFSRNSEYGEKEKCELNRIFNECVQLVGPKTKLNNVELRVLGSDNEVPVYCNEIEVEQIIVNLVGNAVDANHGEDNSWVELSYNIDPHYINIIVRDSGRGISESVVENLFNPFFTTKDIGKGTGLGLSISSGIAKKHGGSLRYELIDGHTAFILSLPRSEEETSRIPN